MVHGKGVIFDLKAVILRSKFSVNNDLNFGLYLTHQKQISSCGHNELSMRELSPSLHSTEHAQYYLSL